ncbi:unnamed protein product [Mesocestoides corti]|uniref:Kinesin-like protein n=1 Tax=Mesocestoides corti TaxID=53468 RepID=A0A0R3U6U3_MESCO|nr:unnamed protein product [Mesocestoides corti]
MTGERSDSLRYTWETDPTAGIVPRALNQIFTTLESMGCDFSVRVSFLELYNEELFDLLSSGEEYVRLGVYDDSTRKGSVLVKGLREVAVHNKEEVYSILEKGLTRRQTASTHLNAQSSRSHTVFTVTVHIKEICPEDDEVFLKIGKLNLVDLAGSENIGRSGALDKRAREAGSINQSLLTLGRVITCLVDHSPHIPYRESKLTRLLQDSLGGKTKTSIIATISPGSSSLEETISTLDYAHRAKNIQNRPEINQKLNKNQLIKGYNEELERLRKDLEAARSKTGIFIDADNYNTMQFQLKQQRARIDDLESRKELLESDLESVTKNFELSQQELTEIREAKERVEVELCKAAEDLRATVYRLEKTERRLHEEMYLRSEHQSTEEKLSEQARDLLSATTMYQTDLSGIHEKLDRVVSLDSWNRSVVGALPNIWLPKQLQEPLDLVASIKTGLSSGLQDLSADLARLREHMALSGEKSLTDMSQLASTLSAVVSANLRLAAGHVDDYVNNQARAIADFRETTMDPVLSNVNELVVELQNKVETIDRRLKAEAKAQAEMLDRLAVKAASLSNSAEAWVRLREVEVEENKRLRGELESRRKAENADTYALVQLLQAQTRVESDKKIDESLAAKCDRLDQLASVEANTLRQLSTDLLGSISFVSESQAAVATSISSDVDCCTKDISRLGSRIRDAASSLDILIESSLNAAKKCMSSPNGVGKQLFDKAADWKSLSAEGTTEVDEPNTDFFVRTVEDSKCRLKLNETYTAESMNKLEDTAAGFSDLVPAMDMVSTALIPRLPALLSDHLAGSIRDYSPTGETPQRRDISYPKEFARTARHSLLLEGFRQTHGFPAQESPLADMSNLAGRSNSQWFLLDQTPSLPTVECDVENDFDRKSGSRASSGLASKVDLHSTYSGSASAKRSSVDTEPEAVTVDVGSD